MNIQATAKIEDIRSSASSGPYEVNEFLKRGWVLIGFYVGPGSDDPIPTQQPHYVVAWQDKAKHPDYPPDSVAARLHAAQTSA